MAERGNTFRRRAGVDAWRGQRFEWGLTVLAYLRCQRLHEEWKKDGKNGIKSFLVANNVDGAGNFDDVVVRVEYVIDSEIKNKIIFVQCKHITNPTKGQKLFPTFLGNEKSLKMFFDSFIEIQTWKGKCDRNDREFQNLKSQVELNENSLKMFFTCQDLDSEVLLYSNIGFKEEDNLGVYQLNKSKTETDITADIFNTSDSELFEIRLNQDDAAYSGFGGNDNMKQQFSEEFRIFLIQAEDLDKHIDTEIELLSNTSVDVDSMRELIFHEVKHHFTISNLCHCLTEKDDTLRNITNFIELRSKGKSLIDNFCRNTSIKNVFSDQVINRYLHTVNSKTEHVIKLQSNFQNFEKFKILQMLLNKYDFDFKSFFIDDMYDIEKWKLARKSITYKKLDKIYVFVINAEISMNKDKRKNEIIIQIVENNEQAKLSDYLQDFSIETENFILNKKVCFQGEITDIKSLCGDNWKMVFDEKSVCDILENKFLKISDPLPTLDFYLQRTFTEEILDQEYYKERTKTWAINSDCIILFTENKTNIPSHDAPYKVFLNRNEARIFVHKLVEKDKEFYHLCSLTNKQFKWIYSFGKNSNLTKKSDIGEDALTNETNEKISILSDVAGMGKTTSLLSLARKYKEKNPSHWVSFIELNKYLDVFRKIHEYPSTEFAVQFIGKTLLNLEENEVLLFTKSCESGKTALFFDAFDEISPDAERSFPLLLLALEKTKIRNIVVSSRPNFASVLEKKLLLKSIEFQGFTTEEKELALEGYWKQMLKKDEKSIDDNLLGRVAKETVALLQLEEKILSEILAIPLQIRMVAIVHYELLLNINSEKPFSSLSPIKLAALYEQFINLHAERFWVEKHKMEWNNVKVDQQERFIKDKLKGAEEIACQIIIPKVLKNDITDRSNEISALCDDVGIITHKSPVVFLHRTVAEYLAAKYLVCKILCNRNSVDIDIVTHILVEDKFNIVRKFINSLLMGTTAYTFGHFHEKKYSFNIFQSLPMTPIHVSASEGNLEIIKTLLSSNNAFLNKRNMYGETAMFYACKYGQNETVKLLLTYKDCSVNIRDSRGDTVLHYASRKGDIEIMKLILQHDSSPINMQNKSGSTPLYEAYKHRANREAVKFLLSLSDCSVNILDSRGNTVLHYASRSGDIEIMKLILQRDSSPINMQNKSGYTPLHEAYNSLYSREAVEFLLSRSDYSVNIRDSDGNTVLHYALKRGDIEIMQLILQRDSSLLNMQNKSGFTPLHEACYRGKTKTVKLFLAQTDCMVNKRDFSFPRGLTALDVARKKNNTEIIELLLQHGAKSNESKCTCV